MAQRNNLTEYQHASLYKSINPETNMKRFNISGYTALVELSSTGTPTNGWWLNDEEELTDDELTTVAELYSDECREWADDCRAEEEYDRKKDARYE